LNAAVFPSVPDGWRNEDTITSPEIYIKMNVQTEFKLKSRGKKTHHDLDEHGKRRKMVKRNSKQYKGNCKMSPTI